MGAYQIIEELQKAGLYKDCLKQGIISSAINYQKYLYEKYLMNMKKAKNKTQAVSDTAEDTGNCPRYIFKVVKIMES